MVDNEIGHDLHGAGQGANIIPATEARIDNRVIGGIEPGISAVDRVEERQGMDAAEQAL